MKEIIFYLDESGNSGKAQFFSVGGFWYVVEKQENNLTKSQKGLLKLQSSLKKLEQDIKLKKAGYTKKTELKWSDLTDQEKEYLFGKLKDYGQNNISITTDITKWKLNQGSTDCTYIYNFLVYIMLERLFKLTNNFLNLSKQNDLRIVLNCDERQTTPESKHSLRDYLQWKFNEFFQQKSLKNPFTFLITYQKSKDTPLIRYADYFVGLVNSAHKFRSGNFKVWDKNSLFFYQLIHQNINCYQCFMYPEWTIKSSVLLTFCSKSW